MLDLFSGGSPSENQARNLAKAIERSTNVLKRNSWEIRKVFKKSGYEFEKQRFLNVSASLFSALILDNIKKREYYDTDEAISAFVAEAEKQHLLHVGVDHTFDAHISDRRTLKQEAATWAADTYFEGHLVPKQANLFYERAETFVEFIDDSDKEQFDRIY